MLAPAVLIAAAPVATQPQVVHGHIPKITRRLTPRGRLDATRHMRVTIGLPLRNREQLTNFLADVYNPSSPNFRHFLKPDEFAAKFGPSQADYQKVINFAKGHGLIVKGTHPNRTLVDVEGSVANIEKAFHVHMLVFQHPIEKRTFFAPDAEPSVDLDVPLLAISGLDNYVKPRPRIHVTRASLRPKVRPLIGPGGGGGGGGNPGPFEGYQFLAAYLPGRFAAAVVDTNVTFGAGQSVGVFELFGFSQQDIMDYEDDAQIPYVTVTPVLIDGASGDDTQYTYFDPQTAEPNGYANYGVEAAADIELAIAMAPNLHQVLVYEGPTPQDEPPLGTNVVQDATTTAQINDVLDKMATDDAANQLSCSYGFDINLSTVQIFQQMAAQGQSFFQASGDSGAFSSSVDEPADDPYVTVVGGTTLTTSTNDDSWNSEVVWLTPAGTGDFGNPTPQVSSGGGISTVYPIPPWQQGISMTANQGSTTMRNLPDVAMVANNITVIWGNDTEFSFSFPSPEAGTSLAAPLWAGFTAIVNQEASSNSELSVGFINPALYAIAKSTNYASCFHDIIVGANTNSSSPTKYFAKAGYDLCSGWGSMNGDNLLPALLAPPVDDLRIKSPVGFTAHGPIGGPFSTNSQTFSVANMGAAPVTWSLINTSSWLNVSSGGGTLNPGDNTQVTVSLNANANQLLIQHVSGNVIFNNLTAGTTQNRQFDLYVGNGGFENGNFTNWTMVGDPALNIVLAGDDADVAGEPAFPNEPDSAFVHSGIYGAYLGQFPGDGEDASGTLWQTVPTTAGQKLLVSFSVASYSAYDPPTNSFSVSWNGSTLFTQTNLLTGSTWTNMQYTVTPTGSSGTLQFEFSNSSGAFALDDVTVEPLPSMVGSSPPPVLNSTTVAGGNISFNWDAIPNDSYQIQSTTNLDAGWTNVGSPIVATNGVMSVSLPTGSAPQGFYRIIKLPQ